MTHRDLQALYKDVVLDHFRTPRRFFALPAPALSWRGKNPLCGDECQIHVDQSDPQACRVAFTGRGCALSMASASILAAFADGKSRDDMARLAAAVTAVLQGEQAPESLAPWGDELMALAGVLTFPVRKKCVQLPWRILSQGLANAAADNLVSDDGRP